MKAKTFGLLAAGFLVTANANAALTSVDGGLGVYDSTYNITWTSNANLLVSQYGAVATIISDANSANGGAGLSTGVVSSSDFSTAGYMTWAGANAWVHYLDVTDYGGSNQWALPTTVDSSSSIGYPDGGSGQAAVSSSQMAELFYGGLGQVAGTSIATTHNANYALFSNMAASAPDAYWSGTPVSATPGDAWHFNIVDGHQQPLVESDGGYAFAVSPGLVSVPLPAAAWLLGSGVLGLLGLGRRKAKTLALRSSG